MQNSTIPSESDGVCSDSTVELTTATDDSIITPSKRTKLEVDSKTLPFRLQDDKYTSHLPSPFPFPTNYSPEINAAIAGGEVTPPILEMFITAIARTAYAHKCYPTAEEFETLVREAVAKYKCFAAGSVCKHVSPSFMYKYAICVHVTLKCLHVSKVSAYVYRTTSYWG